MNERVFVSQRTSVKIYLHAQKSEDDNEKEK